MDTFAIITTEPNDLMAEKTGHDRMPVIIRRSDYQRWLEPGSEEQSPVDLMPPFYSDQMKAWRVDRRINNMKINEPSVDQPIQDDALMPDRPKRVEKPKRKTKSEDSGQLGMFG
jgi:putative SOS response-associated peptidase YedK